MKDCKKYADYLELHTALEKGSEEYIELFEHLKDCEDCSEKYDNIEAYDRNVKNVMEDIQVPDNLQKSIRMSFRFEDKRGRLALYGITSVASSFVLIALFMLKFFNSGGLSFEEVASHCAESHNTYHPMQFKDEVKMSEVGNWFKDKLAFNVKYPDINSNLKLLGGRKCKIAKEDVAYLFLSKNDKLISLYIYDNKLFRQSSEKKVTKKGKDTIVVWGEDEVGYSLVTELPKKDVMEIVKMDIASLTQGMSY